MSSLFRRRKIDPGPRLQTDIHSHLLPELDDGVKDFDEAIELVKGFKALGYRKLVTTPHIMGDFYPNTAEDILTKTDELKRVLSDEGVAIEIECAAEYYLDENLMELLDSPSQILTFGDRYLLFETSFINQPAFLNDAIFKINSLGLKPVMAHPERYEYFHQDQDLIQEICDRGVYFQINLNSLSGYYSRPARRLAKQLIDKKLVKFAGSDCHHIKQLEALDEAFRTKLFEKLIGLDLLNYSV